MKLPTIAFMEEHERQWYLGWDYGEGNRYHLDIELFPDGTHEWFYTDRTMRCSDRSTEMIEGSSDREREFCPRLLELLQAMRTEEK